MKKTDIKRICSMLLIATLLVGVSSCGRSSVGGLGKLDMGGSPSAPGNSGNNGPAIPKPGDSVSTADNTPSPNTQESSTQAPDTQAPSTQEPSTQAPPAGEFATEPYQGELFNVTIPKGWQVNYNLYQTGTPEQPMTRLYIMITDPQDPNNCIYYAHALEPVFDSEAARQEYAQLQASFANAPVLSGGVNAANFLANWGSVYSMLQSENNLSVWPTKNYQVVNIMQSAESEGNTDTMMNSQALAQVGIQGSSKVYVMFMDTTFVKSQIPQFTNSYYTAYSSMGFVGDVEQYGPYADKMLQNVYTFDFSGFLSKYGNGAQGVSVAPNAPNFTY